MRKEKLLNEKKDHNDHVRQVLGETPKERLPIIKKWSSFDVPEGFDPDEISWVTDRLGITDLTGAFDAANQGCYVINTAGEIVSPSNLKIVVDPRRGAKEVRQSLDAISDAISEQLSSSERKVVVHCFMGMERSVLTVVWYLHTRLGLTIDEAYEQVGRVRPIAIDHRGWALG